MCGRIWPSTQALGSVPASVVFGVGRRFYHLLLQHILMKHILCACTVLSSVQSQSCLTLCGPMYCSTPAFSVHHQLPELTQTHVH